MYGGWLEGAWGKGSNLEHATVVQIQDGGLAPSVTRCTDVGRTEMREGQRQLLKLLLPEATQEGREEEWRARQGAEVINSLTSRDLKAAIF